MSAVLQPAASRSFQTWQAGSDIAILRRHESGGVTTLTRFAPGAIGNWHSHPGGEELFVVSGHVRVGAHVLGPGDYLYTSPGSSHDVEAFEETLLLLVLPQLPDYSPQRPDTE